jgi:hypothetical protein
MFTFSNVIACIALFAALGGTVYAAGKISGSQIKPKSIPGNRIKPNSLTGKQIKAGSLTGKQVVGSSLTGVSASSLSSVQYAVAVVTLVPGTPGGVAGTANCPVGTKVIGGGATVSNEEEAFVNDSGPAHDPHRLVRDRGWLHSRCDHDGQPRSVPRLRPPPDSRSGSGSLAHRGRGLLCSTPLQRPSDPPRLNDSSRSFVGI